MAEQEQAQLSAEILPKDGARSGAYAGFFTISVKVRKSLPDFLQSVNLKHVKLGYHLLISNAVYVLLSIPLLFLALGVEFSTVGQQGLLQLLQNVQYNFVTFWACSGAAVFAVTLYLVSRPRPVFLVDFSCYRPTGPEGDSLKVAYSTFLRQSAGLLDDSSLKFQKRILERSGVGQESYFPPALISYPARPSMQVIHRSACLLVALSALQYFSHVA